MPRDLARTKPADEESGGLNEFKGRTRQTKDVPSPVQSGWSADRRVDLNRGDRPTPFKVPDDGEEVLIAFLEDKPFASFFQHWVNTGGKTRKPYICLGTEACPLCDRGDRPKPQDWFNVVEIVNSAATDKGVELPRHTLWYATADPSEKIKERADTKRTSPINKDGQYFAVSKRTGKNGFNTYSVDPVKADELTEDWGAEPLSDVQRKEFLANAHTSDLVKPHTKSELQDVADEHFAD